jgi:hypothetical protein
MVPILSDLTLIPLILLASAAGLLAQGLKYIQK